MSYERKIVNCICCGKTGTHKGRGLRSSCWHRMNQKGRLEEYPLREPTSTYTMVGQSEHIMDRVADFEILLRRGLNYRQISERLGVTERTLVRYAAHLRNIGRGGLNYG